MIDEIAQLTSPVRGPRALGLLRTLWEDRVRPVEPSRLPRALVTVDEPRRVSTACTSRR